TVPVEDAGAADEQAALRRALRLDRQRTPVGGVGGERHPLGEPDVRFVRADVDDHLAADAVCPGDPADDELHRAGTPLVRVDDVDTYPAATDRRDDLAQRLGGAAAAPDDRTEVLGVHPHLQPLATP